jgi:alanine transaminase
MSAPSPSPSPRLNIDNINPHVVRAKYAVRGELAVKSEAYRALIASGDPHDLPFDQVISANIGNPQQLDQKPITFFRQVASLLENPNLLEKPEVMVGQLGYKEDALERAKWLLSQCQSVGAYSASAGVPAIKKSVAKFLESESFALPSSPSACRSLLRSARVTRKLAPPKSRNGPLLTQPQSEMASPPTPPTSTCPLVPPLA